MGLSGGVILKEYACVIVGSGLIPISGLESVRHIGDLSGDVKLTVYPCVISGAEILRPIGGLSRCIIVGSGFIAS